MPPPVVDAVLAWTAHGTHWRDLPWRRTRDPWAVLVSELMLQQTQVPRVIPRYETFLRRFPTPADCAAAPAGEVVRLWAGLGYNRRAVNLHRAATHCVEHHGGALPTSYEDLLALPGVGPYTARAVLAFAYEQDVAVLDTNVARVVARLHGRRLDLPTAQRAADALVPTGEGWRWNQAMLDLGAMVCTKRAPKCDAHCPVTAHCAWFSIGRLAPDPAEGSGGTSGNQSTFHGSDRQGRGRIVDALRSGPLPLHRIAEAAGWPDDPERAGRAVVSLVADGLARVDPLSASLRLP